MMTGTEQYENAMKSAIIFIKFDNIDGAEVKLDTARKKRRSLNVEAEQYVKSKEL